jgi:hypothetical protein
MNHLKQPLDVGGLGVDLPGHHVVVLRHRVDGCGVHLDGTRESLVEVETLCVLLQHLLERALHGREQARHLYHARLPQVRGCRDRRGRCLHRRLLALKGVNALGDLGGVGGIGRSHSCVTKHSPTPRAH